jgi:hypothetical protein
VIVENLLSKYGGNYTFSTVLTTMTWLLLPVSACMLIPLMCVLLALERFDTFYLYVAFNTLSIIGRYMASASIVAPKIGSLLMCFLTPNRTTFRLLENGPNHFGYISGIYRDYFAKSNCTGGTFRKVMIHTLAVKTYTRNYVQYLCTDFIFRFSC